MLTLAGGTYPGQGVLTLVSGGYPGWGGLSTLDGVVPTLARGIPTLARGYLAWMGAPTLAGVPHCQLEGRFPLLAGR